MRTVVIQTDSLTNLETKFLIRYLTTPVQLHRLGESLDTQFTHILRVLGLDLPLFDPFRHVLIHLHRKRMVFGMGLWQVSLQ